MKTLTIALADTIYDRLLTAGTKNYHPEVKNDDYDPAVEGSQPTKPNPDSRDDFLMGVVDQAIRGILNTHEVQEVSRVAVEEKQKEIEALAINTTVS